LFVGRKVSISRKACSRNIALQQLRLSPEVTNQIQLIKTPQNCLHKGLTTYCKRLIREVGFEVKKNRSKKKKKKQS
jgi:hypothetical protein